MIKNILTSLLFTILTTGSYGQFEYKFNSQLPEYRNYWRSLSRNNIANNCVRPTRREPDYLEVTESIYFYRKLIIEPRYYNRYNY